MATPPLQTTLQESTGHISSLHHCIYYLQDTNFREPLRIFSAEEKEKLGLKYYNEEVHRSAFVLPEFAKKVSIQIEQRADLFLLLYDSQSSFFLLWDFHWLFCLLLPIELLFWRNCMYVFVAD